MNKTITSILLAAMLIGTGFVSTGCKTAPTVSQQKRIEIALQSITQVGISIALSENNTQKFRDGISKAIVDLQFIEQGTNNIAISDVLVIVQRLDIKELKSSEGILYLNTGVLLLTSFDIPTSLPLEYSNSIRGIASSIRRGLEVAQQAIPPE